MEAETDPINLARRQRNFALLTEFFSQYPEVFVLPRVVVSEREDRTVKPDEAGFGIAELVLIDTPKGWPQSGFQLVAAWLRKGHSGGWSVVRLAG